MSESANAAGSAAPEAVINPLKERLAKILRIRAFQNNIGGFLEYYFGHVDDPTYQEWDRLFFNHNRVMIECPLGHGKSWRITFGQPIHTVCYNRNIRMLIASKKAERAIEFVERLGNELKTNKKLIEDFGDWALVQEALGRPVTPEDKECTTFYDPENWTKAKFTVRRPKIFREPTCVASGVGGQIEGLRLDYIICDDILDIEDRTSEIERENHKTWLKSTALGRLEPNGKFMAVGTPWHQDDAYAYLEELAREAIQRGDTGPLSWKFVRYQALPGWSGDITKPVKSLFGWRWTWEQLMAKYHEIGDVEFMAKYQCNPRASEGKWFKEPWLKFIDREAWSTIPMVDIVAFGDYNAADRPIKDGDFTAIVVLGRDVKGNFYVIDILHKQLTDSHEQQTIEMWELWRPNRVGVEANLFQNKIYKGIQALNPMCPVIPVVQTANKAMRILKMQPYFQTGRIYLVKDMPHFPNWGPFLREYSAFPEGKHDDILDALQGCFELMGFFNPIHASGNMGIQIIGGVSDFFR